LRAPGAISFFIVLLILLRATPGNSYAVLTHEAIIDACWDKSIKPLLLKRFPNSSEDDLRKAHACAYGGSIIPDIGYYPMGSLYFSNLVHYVRSGDFVVAMIDESTNLREYAFALGALCHYEADRLGHSIATNKAVPILFKRLRKKYGEDVTYEQGKDEHGRVEFGFDVLQTARGNYATMAYHDFIGFDVCDSVLNRAFLKTYGLHLEDVFTSLPAAIAIFRFSVKVILPELTKDAWKIKKSFITQLNPLATEKTYLYKMDRKNYRKEFNRPKPQTFLISLFIGVLPKYGPLSRFRPLVPNPEVEKLFEKSYDAIRQRYTAALDKLHSGPPSLVNIDLDTGSKEQFGEYKLEDNTYYKLLLTLSKKHFEDVDEHLAKKIAAHFSDRGSTSDFRPDSRKGKKVSKALTQLQRARETMGTGIR